MKRPSLLRILPVALLAVVIAVPCARAKEASTPKPALAPVTDLLQRVWKFVSLWMENGCILDPDGSCTLGDGAEPTTDNGCILDPNGSCTLGDGAEPSTDNGCIADPDGHCRPGS